MTLAKARERGRRRRRAAGQPGWSKTRLRQLAQRSVVEYFDDRCPQLAGTMSYYALFALFPLAILSVAVFGLAAGSESARSQVVDLVLENLPVTEDTGRPQIEQALEGVTSSAGAFGVLGILGLVFSASGLMGAVRNGINTAWDIENRRPPLQGKLLDIVLVLALGIVIVASLLASLLGRLVPSLDEPFGAVGAAGLGIVFALMPVALSFAVFSFLYRFVPATAVGLRDVWPGALVAALGFEGAKLGFSFYLENFANYGAIYGSIAGVIVFLLFVFVVSNVFLLGAEIASEVPRVRRGRYDEQEASEEDASLGDQVRDLARRLTLGEEPPTRQRSDEQHPDPKGPAAPSARRRDDDTMT